MKGWQNRSRTPRTQQTPTGMLSAKERRYLWNWCRARGIRVNINMFQQMGSYRTMRRYKRDNFRHWLSTYLIPAIEARMEWEKRMGDRSYFIQPAPDNSALAPKQ